MTSQALLPENNPRALRALTLASHWLATANEAQEEGDTKRAEGYYAKSQYWLDRYNKLIGNA